MDIIAILTAAKEMGFEGGQIVSLIMIFFMLKNALKKSMDEQFGKLIAAIEKLEKTHNERLKKIEDHIGLK